MNAFQTSGVITALCLFLAAFPTSAPANDLPAGSLRFPGSDPQKILDVYRELANVELVIDSRAARIHTPVTYESVGLLTPEEACKQVEDALREQAGLVITRLEGKRVSVTYNDALPIKKVQKSESP